MEEEKIQLEKAKSWFVLAQILVILAGFFFASSSIFFTNAQNNLDSSANNNYEAIDLINFQIQNIPQLIDYNLSEDYQQLIDSMTNHSNSLSDLSKANGNYASTSFKFAVILIFISIIFFFLGRYKLSKLKCP